MELQDSHLRRAHQPRAIPRLEATQAVEAVAALLTEAAFGGGRGPLLFVQRQTLHTTVHLNATQEVVQFYTSNPNTHTEQREALILNVVGLQMTEQLLYLTEAR